MGREIFTLRAVSIEGAIGADVPARVAPFWVRIPKLYEGCSFLSLRVKSKPNEAR